MSLYKRGDVWWYKFRFAGQVVRESSKSESKMVAKDAERARRRELEESWNQIKRRKLPPFFSVAAADWLKTRTAIAASTERSYKLAISQLNKDFGKQLLCDISGEEGGQVQQRLGLTIKRRAHFTNIYAPFCPDCGQAAESKKALQTHLAMAHGKRLTHYKRKQKSAVLGNLSRPLNIESLDLKGKLPKEYLSDMKRIWRLSGVGHSDLVLAERITRKPPKEKALYPICVAIVTSGLVEAITTAPKRMRRVTEYVRQHSDLVRGIQQQQRYVRLKTREAKAKLLSLGLANPTISLTYAERSKAKARDFKKDQRALRYAKKRSV